MVWRLPIFCLVNQRKKTSLPLCNPAVLFFSNSEKTSEHFEGDGLNRSSLRRRPQASTGDILKLMMAGVMWVIIMAILPQALL